MANHKPIVSTVRATARLLFLAIVVTRSTSARILNEELPTVADSIIAPESSNPAISPVADSAVPAEDDALTPAPAVASPLVSPTTGATTPVAADAAAQAGANGTTVGNPDPRHPLSFLMHDVLGGSNQLAKAVTGIVLNPAVNQIAFAKPNDAVIPAKNGVPLTNTNNGIINSNNLPFLTGLGGPTSDTLPQYTGSNVNSGSGLPFLTSGQFPSGTSLQQLLFGTMTVIDDELTEGHELGSPVVGKAQGFYVASSEDGTSQALVFTAMFASDQYVDSISFFGVHCTGSSESQVAIMGGTGKYTNAKGFATIRTIHPAVDQHTTDGVETLLQFAVYLS